MTENSTPNTIASAKLPTIAIVGRPNVGKSSLFNAIIGRRMAIVHEQSGVTRDRVAAVGSFQGRHFQLIDTGGLGTLGATRGIDQWDEHIAEQVFNAVADADLLVLVVNVQQGVVPLDEDVAMRLRATGKPILLAVNKSDNPTLSGEAVEFTRLGFDDYVPISCLHRLGIDTLLETALRQLPGTVAAESEEPAIKPLRIAVIGRPNVGKSSLVNALLGEERVITSAEAGTTRDAVDVDFQIKYRDEMRPAILVDTAGLRKTAKVHNAVEMFSVMRAQSAIERADLVVMVVEAGLDGVTAQDRRVAGLIEKAHKACIIAANKYDLCLGQEKLKVLQSDLRRNLPGLAYAPLVFVSAAKRLHLNTLLDGITAVAEQLELKLSTALVNRVLLDAFEKLSPPVVGISPLRLYYTAITGQAPPRFLLFVNKAANCAPNYLAYLKNSLRQAFDLTGLPIILELRDRPKKVVNFHTAGRGERRSRK